MLHDMASPMSSTWRLLNLAAPKNKRSWMGMPRMRSAMATRPKSLGNALRWLPVHAKPTDRVQKKRCLATHDLYVVASICHPWPPRLVVTTSKEAVPSSPW